MNKISVIFVLLFSIKCFSQNSFYEGYFIDNTNQKINCFIKSFDKSKSPLKFSYKLSVDDEVKETTIKSVKEFGIDNDLKFIRSDVEIDRSSSIIRKLSVYRNPNFNEETVFLRVLVEGEVNLYQYTDVNLIRFFYKTENSILQQLVFKNYKTSENKIAENNYFRQQILNSLKCDNISKSRIQRLNYKKNDLVRLFKDYSKCKQKDLIYTEIKHKRDFFNLSLRPRLNISSLDVENSAFSSEDVIEFDNKVGFGFGVEAEFIIPINKDKWSILIEPTFQSFKSEKTINNVSVIFGGEITSRIDYTSIEIPVSLRHYFLLNKDSKVFIDASVVFDISSKSSYEYKRSDTNDFFPLGISSSENIAFGVGYKYQKYNLQMRYQFGRELLEEEESFIWSSNYKTFSVILGYSLF